MNLFVMVQVATLFVRSPAGGLELLPGCFLSGQGVTIYLDDDMNGICTSVGRNAHIIVGNVKAGEDYRFGAELSWAGR